MFSSILVASTDFSFADVKRLPPLEEPYWQLSPIDKVAWLKKAAGTESNPVARYRLLRSMVSELTALHLVEDAKRICLANEPLKDDFFLRDRCIEVGYPEIQEFKVEMFKLIDEARKTNDNDIVAELLYKLAWRQSQSGEIAGAFSHYEEALAIVSSENNNLLNEIMFHSASNYIVYGSDFYVRKGIELLRTIRAGVQEKLKAKVSSQDFKTLQFSIQLTYFNSGVAYMLHLYDYEKALLEFDELNHLTNAIGANALTYSALAAAKLGQHGRAKKYLYFVEGLKDGDPVIDSYLACYRQLAEQHWNTKLTLSKCFSLHKKTTVEVQLDLYKRLSDNPNSDAALFGLRKLKELYISTLEPQLRSRGSQAASNLEMKRLQRESELKSLVLTQQKQLQEEIDAKHSNRQMFFIALLFIFFLFILFVVSQLRQKKRLAQQYQQMSVIDSLTQLGNRRFLEQQIERELAYVERAVKNGQSVSLGIYIFDIDHFKKVNDTYGHSVGDEVLKEISVRVKKIIRDTDLLVRWGGEEFVFVARLDNTEQMFELGDRILSAVNGSPFKVSDNQVLLDITCTIGKVQFPFIDTSNFETWTRLISLADTALYYGKSLGRNCWVAINNKNIVKDEDIDELISRPLSDSIESGVVFARTSNDNLELPM